MKCGCGKQVTMLIQINLEVCITRCWICKDCYNDIEDKSKVLFDFYPDGNPFNRQAERFKDS